MEKRKVMDKKKVTSYEILVYVAYGYFIALGLAWLILSFAWGSYFNYWAFLVILLFAVQAWYKHKLTNLILGVLALPLSIYGALEFFWAGGTSGFDPFVKMMIALSVVGMIMAGILLFSYMKLGIKDQQ